MKKFSIFLMGILCSFLSLSAQIEVYEAIDNDVCDFFTSEELDYACSIPGLVVTAEPVNESALGYTDLCGTSCFYLNAEVVTSENSGAPTNYDFTVVCDQVGLDDFHENSASFSHLICVGTDTNYDVPLPMETGHELQIEISTLEEFASGPRGGKGGIAQRAVGCSITCTVMIGD